MLEKIEKEIAAADVISFDVFDTLLVRNIARPEDVFTIVQERFNQATTMHITSKFSDMRRHAEHLVFTEQQGFTYTLDDIYKKLQGESNLSAAMCQALQETECEIEELLLTKRALGVRLYELAKKHQKRIIIVSDMYLPASVIKRALKENGFDGYDELIVSAGNKIAKADGRAYQYILKNYSAEKVLHIGDNKQSDFDQARSFGLRAVLIPKEVDSFSSDEIKMKKRLLSLSHSSETNMQASIITALLARKLDTIEWNSTEYPPEYILGYSLGPALLGFIQWIQLKAEKNGNTHLYFLARDGALVKQAYDLYYGGTAKHLPATYTFASRRLYNFAAIRGRLKEGDILFLSGSLAEKTTVADVFERFDIDRAEVASSIKQVGLEFSDTLDSDIKRQKLRSAIIVAEDIILAHAAKERAVLLSYLNSIGLLKAESPAVIDVGWHGTLQRSLDVLTGRALQGYYFGQNTETRRKDVDMEAYTDQITLDRPDLFHTPDYVTIVEQFFTNPDQATIVGIDQKSGGEFVAKESSVHYRGEQADQLTIKLLQQGALAFIDDFKQATDQLPAVASTISRSVALRWLLDIITTPSPVAAEVFGRLHHFDGYGAKGYRLQYVGYPTGGFHLNPTDKQLKSQFEKTYWRAGFLKNAEINRRRVR